MGDESTTTASEDRERLDREAALRPYIPGRVDLLPVVTCTTRLSVNGSTSIVVQPPAPCGLPRCVAEVQITHRHGDTTRLHINARQRRELIEALGGQIR